MSSFLYYSRLLQFNIQTLKCQALQNPFRKSHSQANPPPSFLQFLQNSCGLSPARALKVCERFADKPRNADSVLAFLKTNGFSDTHIKSIITVTPTVLSVDAESILRPKIQFFKDKGISDSDIIELIVSRPTILSCSLERSIKPLFSFLLSHLGTDANIIKSMKKVEFRFNLHRTIIPNVETLKCCGVPDCRISRLILSHPTILTKKPDQFDEHVKMTVQMGFNPLSHGFVEAIRVMACLSRSSWEMKFDIFRGFGWSDAEILSAFRNHPSCITASKEKIRKGMDFFINKLGWSFSYISSGSSLLSLSLEKRILPRQRFLKALAAKGLIAEDRMFKKKNYFLSEKQFLENYVSKFQVKFPEIPKLYEHMMDQNDPESGYQG